MDVHRFAEALLADPEPGGPLELARHALAAAGCVVDEPVPGALRARRGRGGVVFSGHVDVVPAGEGWHAPPFGGSMQDGRLVGRGASDMRGPVAAMVAAVAATDAPVSVLLTSDEETTMDQARTMAAAGVLDDAPLVIVGEPTELEVATCSKGVAWLDLVVNAPAGHASTPRAPDGRGASAAERLVELLASLPHRPVATDHAVLGPATAALSGLTTGNNPYNVLASEARARIDCRFPSPLTPTGMRDAIAEALGLPTDDATLTLVKEEPSFEGATDQVDDVLGAMAAVGIEREAIGVMYASEAGHWGPRAPTLVCGPGSIVRAHAPDEHILASELEEAVTAYMAILAHVASR